MKRRGFTIVEIIVVLLVAALVVVAGFRGVQGYIQKVQRTEAIMTIGEISDAIRKQEKVNGALPATLAAAGFGSRVDPWGFAYQYINLATGTGNGIARKDKNLSPLNSDFDLYSLGPDGVTAAQLSNSASRDDVVRARDGAFIGLAEEFDP